MQTAYFAGGCFWCVEAVFQRISGVASVESGYCNGLTQNPTYVDICTGLTGHAEVVKVNFDESQLSFTQLLQVFFATHDATTLNQQGNDKGTQYRSAIFYENIEQKNLAQQYMQTLGDKIVTEVSALDVFYPAENYHQNYFNNNPDQAYCRMLIMPKLNKYFNS
ncbi:methionine sulfoxide reductase A [Candidatus Thioglobus autotrophicus]|uniref:Peptide methionine sulfoxide reductase MsrA n=1 Tax=Candidatus Thioglobus autotrophicus TaxID=1705394 RepID=A0A0M4PAF7_9GAMM|nr:peptide-methionine (S)-S-oxide reductase MsrA [Candidatus Thioglobus autotrophicus]ALE53272.1 methionine sulfoxide reductase A [Candidatus Thioglobus autotrophicus]